LTLEKIKKEFRDPSNRFRFAAFWFWNHELQDEELIWQIREMKTKGIGGFVMHPRHGLATPYLSTEWFKRITCAIKEAARLKMKAYLYDENNWPSGTADAKVIEENPDFRMSCVRISQQFKARGKTLIEEKLKTVDGLIGVIAVPIKDGKIFGFPKSVVNLAPYVQNEFLMWNVPKGSWLILVYTRKFLVGTFFGSYLDTLNKDAVKRFIELTHKAYADRFRGYFGNVVPGIFTDEPSCNYNFIIGLFTDEPYDPRCIPWTPSLAPEFNLRHRYDLFTSLPALFYDVGPQTARIRCDFYDTVTFLYQQAFFKQIYDFCDKVGLSTLGHVDCEGELLHQIRHQGDFFKVSEWMHYAGVDLLWESTWPDIGKGPNNLAGPKFASSAGHLLGKPVVMSESFALAGQWAIDLRTLKRLSDWQIALGVNLLMPASFYYSIQGFRKWECPPGEFYQSTFWPYYRALADYVGRLCSLFSEGKHMAKVAILYPAKSMWASLDPDSNPKVEKIVSNFERVSIASMRVHFDFDYISEELLQSAEVSHGSIEVKNQNDETMESFRVLLIPTCTTISRKTLETVRKFYKAGGKLLATGLLPTQSTEKGEDPEISKLFSDIFMVEVESLYKQTELKLCRQTSRGGTQAILITGVDVASEGDVENILAKALCELTDPDVTIHENGQHVGDVVYMHRLREGKHFFFLVNTSRTKSFRTLVTLGLVGKPEFWDPVTGCVKPVYCYTVKDGKTHVPLLFEPTQTFVISVTPDAMEKASVHVVDTNLHIGEIKSDRIEAYAGETGDYYVEFDVAGTTQRREVSVEEALPPIVLTDEWHFKTEKPNALPLRDWKYSMNAEILDKDHVNGFHRYETSFSSAIKPREAKILVDGLVIEKVWRGTAKKDVKFALNGNEITEFGKGRYLDHLILEADVTPMIRKGENVLSIQTAGNLYEIPNLAHPPILTGRFKLSKKKERWILEPEVNSVKTGSWTEQGYPYYSGVALYEQRVEIPKKYLSKRLILKLTDIAESADVWVNGKQVAVLPWEPLEVEISDHVQPGENVVTIKVANSLQNLLVKEKSSGILGRVEIVPHHRLTIPY